MEELKEVMVMVVVQLAYTGMNVLYKLVAAAADDDDDGMSLRVLVAYRWLFSTSFILPLALFLERGRRPKLTRTILFQAFLCGLFGGLVAQNSYVESLALTSATFVTAISNLVPAATLILALSFRMERLEIGTRKGKAKVMGTIIGIGGAMVLTFYKGPSFPMATGSSNFSLLKHTHHHHHPSPRYINPSNHISGAHILGPLLAFASCTSCALWLIIQTKMSENYPCHYSSAAMMSIMASIQCVAFSLCTERDWTKWKLGWNLRLLTAAYTGIVTSGVVVTLIAWCVKVRGPVFVSSFSPLSLVLITIAASFFLEENLHLGSVIGGGLIVSGLYMVLWGKSQELKEKESPPIITTSDLKSNSPPP